MTETTTDQIDYDKRFGEFYWVGHPAAGAEPGTIEEALVTRRSEIQLIGGVTDAQACYSYDDFALIRFDGAYYLLNTSGCSCPSPTETWSVSLGPLTLEEMRAELAKDAGDPKGYGVTKRQADEFQALCDKAAAS